MKYNYYQLSFKQSVLNMYYSNNRKNIKYILDIFKISKSSLYNWVRLYESNKLTKNSHIKKNLR